MAIYHFSAKVIQRSHGRSAVAAAAYRSASELDDERVGRSYDYTVKQGVVHSKIILPPGAPARWQDRSTLWNEVEVVERRYDAVLAREVEFALPHELSQAEGIALAQAFVREQFVACGMVADLNVHWPRGPDNGGREGIGGEVEARPHAHVMLTMRGVDGDGFGNKRRDWNDRPLLRGWRERWAELANERLAELGHDVRIDHRSNAAQGIDLEPQNKIGPAGARREQRGENAERAAEHVGIARRNGEQIIAEPGVVLDAITRQQSTFTRRDLARFVDRHTADAAQFELAMARAEAAPELVWLGRDGRGQERFTTREMLEAERRMEHAAGVMAEGYEHLVLHPAAWRVLRAAARGDLALGDEQQAAFRHVTSGPDLALVVGYAGTGKSAMLGVARAAWEAEGYAVRGATLSGIAAEGLEAGSGIASRTLASLEFAWKDGRDLLGPKDVLVVDEAGLVGSRQMERVLSAAQRAGAKVVLVGDPEQLQAIEAGSAFRALAERHGAAEISEVRRQRVEWQRRATRELATERTGVALERYAAAGMVHAAATREAARVALVAGWDAVREQSPQASQVMLAYTRDDVRALNELARERLRLSGALRGADQAVQTERGERAFAVGERIMFGRNERGLGAAPGTGTRGQGGVAVKNGTLGTLLAVEAGDDGARLTVRLDGPSGSGGAGGGGKGAGPAGRDGLGAVVTFSLRDYAHVEHGYAATIHKAQGVTADRAHVLASGHMDRHAAYVALTRHRDGVALHYGRDEFADGRALARTLGRERRKDTSLDYEGLPSAPGRDGDALAGRYAERRGLDPLHPVSEIVARTPEPATEQQQPTARPPGMFDGLRLNAAPLPKAPVPAPAPEPDGAPLSQALVKYLAALRVAEGMQRQDLPVLAHQHAAINAAANELDACRPGFTGDLNEVARRRPDLARQAFASAAGLAPLIAAAQRLPADRKAEQEAEAERQAKADAQRAEHEALAPARERLLQKRMRDWWQTNRPYARLSDYGFPAAQAEANVAEAVIRFEIEQMPAAELRPIAARLARADQRAAREAAARPGPSPSPY